MSAAGHELDELRELERAADFEPLIGGLRERIEADRRTLADPWVKSWCGRRWRNIFVGLAADDPDAVSVASRRISVPGTDVSVRAPGPDERPERQRIAERFLLDAHGEWADELPEPRAPTLEGTTIVFCPGLIGTMLPLRAFELIFPMLAERRGWRIVSADAHPARGCEPNVNDLRAAIERGEGLDARCEPIAAEQAEPPGDVILIGYSKGTPDALTLLAHRPDLGPRVKALFCWGGAAGGSYLADDIDAQLERVRLPTGGFGDAIRAMLKALFPIVRLEGITDRLDDYDVKGAIRDLTTDVREQFMREHGPALDALDLPIFNLTGATRAMEVPFFQVQGYLEIARRDPDNDMQLTQEQARVRLPMATDLAVLRAHHWDLAYDPFPVHTRLGSPNLDHPLPREAAVSASVLLAAELGLVS